MQKIYIYEYQVCKMQSSLQVVGISYKLSAIKLKKCEHSIKKKKKTFVL